jgi:hypothetical protein
MKIVITLLLTYISMIDNAPEAVKETSQKTKSKHGEDCREDCGSFQGHDT